MKISLATPIAIVAVLLSLAALLMSTGGQSIRAGGTLPTTSYDATVIAKAGLRVGSTTAATTLTKVVATTCNASLIGASMVASSTAQFYCAVSGVNVGDRVLVMLPIGAGANASGSGSPGQGFVASAGYATSTGVVGFTITNLTGAATSSFAQATTSVQLFIFK